MSIDPNWHLSMELPAKYKALSYHFLINKGNTNLISATGNCHTHNPYGTEKFNPGKHWIE